MSARIRLTGQRHCSGDRRADTYPLAADGSPRVGPVEASGWTTWPPRLPDQPIFYPVLNEQYATKIARDWNVRGSGAGYVTRFRVRKVFFDRYNVRQVGGRAILEYWIPAADLDEFNANIVGNIGVVAEYH